MRRISFLKFCVRISGVVISNAVYTWNTNYGKGGVVI